MKEGEVTPPLPIQNGKAQKREIYKYYTTSDNKRYWFFYTKPILVLQVCWNRFLEVHDRVYLNPETRRFRALFQTRTKKCRIFQTWSPKLLEKVSFSAYFWVKTRETPKPDGWWANFQTQSCKKPERSRPLQTWLSPNPKILQNSNLNPKISKPNHALILSSLFPYGSIIH